MGEFWSETVKEILIITTLRFAHAPSACHGRMKGVGPPLTLLPGSGVMSVSLDNADTVIHGILVEF